MSELPDPPAHDGELAEPPRLVPTGVLLERVLRLLLAMFLAAVLLAVLPVPAIVHVIVLMVLPVFALVSAITFRDHRQTSFVHRYAWRLWELRHDRSEVADAGERAGEPVTEGLRRAWLLMGICVTVFLVGLVLAGLSAGVSERLYG